MDLDTTTRNGFKYTAGVLHQAPDSGHTGGIYASIVIWKDAWAINTDSTPTGNSTVRSYSTRGYLYTGTPTYSACHYGGVFQMKVPAGTANIWTATDAQNLIHGIVDAFAANGLAPFLQPLWDSLALGVGCLWWTR